jgi:hypothetical protein
MFKKFWLSNILKNESEEPNGVNFSFIIAPIVSRGFFG